MGLIMYPKRERTSAAVRYDGFVFAHGARGDMGFS